MIVAVTKKKEKKEFNFKFLNVIKKWFSNSWVCYIALLYVIAFLSFGYTLINNSMVIPVSGDFVIQEIPFYFNGYDDWWKALSTGNFPLWDESAMLGVNNIGANSFYYLFNIFFLPTLLFPRFLIPQVQAFLIITKIVIAGIGMRKLLEIFKISTQTCFIVGLAYAFCGWNLCYLWFNHFFEIAALMPFFLLSIEILLRKRKMLPLVFTLFIVGITNYFFLIAFCFTGAIYAAFRYFQRFKEMKKMNQDNILDGRIIKIHVRLEIILKGICGFALGLGLACLVLLPCFDAVLSNPRVTNASYLDNLKVPLHSIKIALSNHDFKSLFSELKVFFSYLSSWKAVGANATSNTKYLMYPAVSFFFPTITCYDSILFVNNGFDNHQASLYLFTPLTLMLIPSILNSFREKKISHIIGVIGILIFLFTPFAYYCFSGFTENAYGRWQIFVVAIYCIYAAINLDKIKNTPGIYFDISIVFTCLMQYFLITQAKKLSNDNASATKVLDNERLTLAYAMIFVTIGVYLFIRISKNRNSFLKNLKYFIAVEAVIFTNVVLQVQGTTDYNNSLYGGKKNTSEEVSLVNRIKDMDNSYYRLFSTTADRTGNNLGMMYGSRGVGTFHSVYDYNLDEFLNWSQCTYGYGGWSMGIHEKRVLLDEFLGIKYYLLKNNDVNVPFGFEEVFSTDTHTVYTNTNFIELGFSFDKLYADSDSYSYNRVFKNELSYLHGVIVDRDVAIEISEKYPSIKLTTSTEDVELAINKKYHVINNPNYKIYDNINGSLVEVKSTSSLHYGAQIVVTLSNGELGEYATSYNPLYIDLNARMGENLMIYFYDIDDKLLTYDNHMTHWYSKNGDIKTNRGFYVNKEVRKIIISLRENLDNNRYLLTPTMQYMYYNDYLEIINSLKENAIKDVKIISSDQLKFKTDYQEDRMVYLSIPYDKGWSLVDENNNKVKLYKVNGGFVGFVSEEGLHSYTLTYVTPSLLTGLKLTFISTTIVEIYYVANILLEEEKQRRSLLLLNKIR